MKKNPENKKRLGHSAKVLLTLIGVNAALSLSVIVAALAADHPKYNKSAHINAKYAYDVACDSYAITYTAAARDAESAVRMAFEMERCDDDVRYDKLSANYDSLTNEMENRISDSLSCHQGLIAVTDEMAAALATLEKYERDSIVYAQWAAQPLNRRVNSGLRKIFMNEYKRIVRNQQSYIDRLEQNEK